MATATGTWIATSNINAGFIDLARQRSKEITKDDLIDQRKYHYSFNVEDKGVDVSGFIVHTAKKNQGRHKFRVHLDSNDNGRFDKNDLFYGHSGLKTKDSKKGVGQILDEGEVGELKIKFKTLESNASMKSAEGHLDPIIKVMKFKHSSLDTTASMRTSGSSTVAEVSPYLCTALSMCDTSQDSFGLVECSTCFDEFLRRGCSNEQAQNATLDLEDMICCTGDWQPSVNA